MAYSEYITSFATVLQQQSNIKTTVKQYSIMTTQLDLDKLRAKLPRGYGKLLATATGKTENAVYQSLKGKFYSPIIIKEAVNLAKEYSQDNNDIASEIDNL